MATKNKEEALVYLDHRLFSHAWLIMVLSFIIVFAISGVFASMSKVMQSGRNPQGFLSLVSSLLVLCIDGLFEFGLSFMILKKMRGVGDFILSDLFSGFKLCLSKVVLLSFLNAMYLFLWTLLLIIPGIIKMYSYSQAYFIAVDNSALTPNQCITRSRELMQGNKASLFFLDLSFLGWFIIGLLTCGIAMPWVVSYHKLARASFYDMILQTSR